MSSSSTARQQGWEAVHKEYTTALLNGDTTTALQHVIHVNGSTDEQLYPVVKRYSDILKAELAAVAQSELRRVNVEEDGNFVSVYDRVVGLQAQAEDCMKTQLSKQTDGTWRVMDWSAQAPCPPS